MAEQVVQIAGDPDPLVLGREVRQLDPCLGELAGCSRTPDERRTTPPRPPGITTGVTVPQVSPRSSCQEGICARDKQHHHHQRQHDRRRAGAEASRAQCRDVQTGTYARGPPERHLREEQREADAEQDPESPRSGARTPRRPSRDRRTRTRPGSRRRRTPPRPSCCHPPTGRRTAGRPGTPRAARTRRHPCVHRRWLATQSPRGSTSASTSAQSSEPTTTDPRTSDAARVAPVDEHRERGEDGGPDRDHDPPLRGPAAPGECGYSHCSGRDGRQRLDHVEHSPPTSPPETHARRPAREQRDRPHRRGRASRG